MATSRKRSRTEAQLATDDIHADCKYSVEHPRDKNWWEKRGRPKKQKRSESVESSTPVLDSKEVPLQLSPFAPTGSFYHDPTNNLDRYFRVVGPEENPWHKLNRYNSFVLHGVKYLSDGYVFVANSSTFEQPRMQNGGESSRAKTKPEESWVARILEIRASDEHHVYARVYWLYWPEELPPNSRYKNKVVSGRQPYHGHHELIASNHMDIINVVSVTSPAIVNQWDEQNEDEVQQALYWRQAWDARSMELSLVAERCVCREPENPDKTLIRCSNSKCSLWLHDDCLIHDALMDTWKKLGSNKPHISSVKQENDNDAAGRLPSPSETDSAQATRSSIAVKPEETHVRLADVENVPSSVADPETQDVKHAPRTSQSKKGRPPKTSEKPYIGRFEAAITNESGNPPTMEITDLRHDVLGGESAWKEPVKCIKCRHIIQ